MTNEVLKKKNNNREKWTTDGKNGSVCDRKKEKEGFGINRKTENEQEEPIKLQ